MSARRVTPMLFLILATLVAAAPSRAADRLPSAAIASAPRHVKLIARNGFGDDRNSYAWSMARFKGKLYVGTGRMIACVENQTVDFFLRVSQRYVTEPYPGATCP